MNTNKSNSVLSDEGLKTHFRHLRQKEAETAPPVLSVDEMRSARGALAHSWMYGPGAMMAVAASLLFAVVFLMLPTEQPDAGIMYADIMAASSFTTDPLLTMTHGESPETAAFPDVFQIRVLEQ